MVIWVTQMLSVWIVSKQKWRGVDMTLSFMSVVRPVGEWVLVLCLNFPDRVGLYVIHKQKNVNCCDIDRVYSWRPWWILPFDTPGLHHVGYSRGPLSRPGKASWGKPMIFAKAWTFLLTFSLSKIWQFCNFRCCVHLWTHLSSSLVQKVPSSDKWQDFRFCFFHFLDSFIQKPVPVI